VPNYPYFTTGDAIFNGSFWIAVQFPLTQGNWAYSQFLAALDNMAQSPSWIENGETTGEEAAALFASIASEGIFDMPWSIGDIKYTAAPPVNATWLVCDGTLYVGTDYPDLFARIGTAFNQPGDPYTSMRTPDMRGRVPAMTNNGSGILPSWGDTPGGIGGEAAHTLIASEMPSHTHTDTGHVHSGIPTFITTAAGVEPALASVEVPLVTVPTGIGNASLTSTGGDGSHNNIQPTFILACYILAAF